MANEIAWRHSATAKNVYVTIRNSARLYWNKDTDAPALEALAVANWYNAAATDGNYWITLTETPGSSYFYVGDWPALLTAVGFYWLDVYERVGATPAISDTLIGGIIGYWNGTALRPWAADLEQVAGTAQTAGDIIGTLTAIKGAGWTTETLAAIDVLIDAIKAKTDLITTGTALTVVAGISGSIMTIAMTASYGETITGLTIPATWTKLWWTLKATAEDADSAAILQLIVSNPAAGATDGVLYVMGAAATVAQRTLGSLTVNQAGGTVAVALDETLTAVLRASSGFVWDVKCLESGGAATILTTGAANIARTVTRAVA